MVPPGTSYLSITRAELPAEERPSDLKRRPAASGMAAHPFRAAAVHYHPAQQALVLVQALDVAGKTGRCHHCHLHQHGLQQHASGSITKRMPGSTHEDELEGFWGERVPAGLLHAK